MSYYLQLLFRRLCSLSLSLPPPAVPLSLSIALKKFERTSARFVNRNRSEWDWSPSDSTRLCPFWHLKSRRAKSSNAQWNSPYTHKHNERKCNQYFVLNCRSPTEFWYDEFVFSVATIADNIMQLIRLPGFIIFSFVVCSFVHRCVENSLSVPTISAVTIIILTIIITSFELLSFCQWLLFELARKQNSSFDAQVKFFLLFLHCQWNFLFTKLIARNR